MSLTVYQATATSGSDFALDNPSLTRGNRIFVHSGTGTDATNLGQSPSGPVATLSYALGLCTASQGDHIYLMEGHAQTLAAATTIDKAGVRIFGRGVGTNAPQFTVNFAGDGFNVTADDVLIENLYFNEATAAATANINLGAARTTIRGCHFDLGANDLDNITVPAGGAGSRIEGNTFRVTADGPDSAITVEGSADNLAILANYFDGGSTTNKWDDAAIDLGSTTPTNVRVEGNTFAYGTAVVSTGATPRVHGNNFYLRGARPVAGAQVDIYASASVTGTKSGTKEDPTTLVDGVNLLTAGDRLLLYKGTYTVTASLALDVANVVVQPVDYVPGVRSTGVEIANDTDDINTADVTAAGVSLLGLFFTKGAANTTDGTELIDVGSNGFTLKDCILDFETRANADGVNIATATKHHLIDNCLFTDPADGKGMIVWACSTMEVKNCIFDFSAADALAFEQLASFGAGSFIHDNLIVSDNAVDPWASWQASAVGNVMTKNYVFGTGADADGGGDQAALDPFAWGNYRDGATDGTTTALNPSVS